MCTTLLLLVFCSVGEIVCGPPPGPVEVPRDKPKYQGNRPSQTVSNKCYTYDGLLNDMLPMNYLDDPVKDLRLSYISFPNLNAEPNEKYYLTVLKTNDAVRRNLLKPKPATLKYHYGGMKSQLYLTAPDYFENRLISHADIGRARRYFTRKLETECGTAPDHMGLVNDPKHGNKDPAVGIGDTGRKCFDSDQIRECSVQMRNIDTDSAPGPTYFRLVLKINRAVQCKQLTVIEGTLINGALGVKTEQYIFEDENRQVRLPSIKDRRQARAFFNGRKHMPETIPGPATSNSQSGGGTIDVTKGMPIVAGAAFVARKTGDSSSDESGVKHNKRGSSTHSATHPVDSETHPNVPLYPIKEAVGTAPPKETNTFLPSNQKLNDPILLRQSSLIRDEDIDIRV